MDGMNLSLQGHSGNGFIPQGSDAGLYVIFKNHQEKMNFESERQGRPVFKTYEYVEIHGAEGKNVVSRRATDHDRARFPKQYEAFKLGQAQIPVGTPIEEWSAVDESRRYELKALKLFTVEQIAHCSDQTLQVMGPDARSLRERAQQFLMKAEQFAKASEIKAENDALKARLAALEAKLMAPEEPKKRSRGRPKKSEAEQEIVLTDEPKGDA